MSISLASTRASLARRGVKYVLGGATVATASGTAYVYTSDSEQVAGFRRQAQFWSNVFPIVADYYWKTSRNSPLVRFQKLIANGENEDDFDEELSKQKRKELLHSLHKKHAPTMLQVMLDLRGLYIKLGQVLSVSALPIPEEYKKQFRTLQSDVPGHEEFDSVVKPTLEKELGRPLGDLFEYIDPIPCGAASIGQAHKAILKDSNDEDGKKQVIIKVQYPDAAWKVPADIQCVGDFLKICVWAGVVDKESSEMSFNEFSRQFLAELDYDRERQNLQTVRKSSLDPTAPYIKYNVLIPKVFEDLCTDKVITMTYLPGPTMEAEARRQLELLGIDTSVGISQIIKNAATDASENQNDIKAGELVRRVTKAITDESNTSSQGSTKPSWKVVASQTIGKVIRVNTILWTVRVAKKALLLSQAMLVSMIQKSPKFIIKDNWEIWAEAHSTAAEQAERLGEIETWCTALFDVHGHQVFNLGLFNADPHPGNILVVEDPKSKKGKKKFGIGLIDYGQCKKLTEEEQLKIARLILSVANNESDQVIASAFRELNIITSNDSTKFLAEFGKLMFGPFRPEHMQHSWHMDLHKTDKVLYFPKELSMVYRTSLLLRGLAVSLQMNYSIGEQWKHHARDAVMRIESSQKKVQ